MVETEKLRILLIEDDKNDYLHARSLFESIQNIKVSLAWAAGYKEGLEALRKKNFDAAFVDDEIGGQSGITLIRETTAGGYSTPLILFTSQWSLELNIAAMEAGVSLSMTKREATPLLLERAIRYATKRQGAEQAQQHRSEGLSAARTEAENEKRRLEAVLEALPVGVAITDAQGGRIKANKEYDRIWGDPPPARTIRDYNAYQAWWADTGQAIAAEEWASAQAVQKGETVIGQVLQIQRFDGTRAWVINSASPVRDASGNIVGSAVSIQDITALREAEAALHTFTEQLKQSNKALEEFAFVASHDLQEPLRKVRSFAELLKTRYGQGLTDEGREYLDRMQQAAMRMQSMIQGLLEYSLVNTRNQPVEWVDLRQVTAEVLTDLEVRVWQMGGRVDVGELPVIEADPLQMRQLIQNLVSNALKFHRPDAPPQVSISSKPVPNNCIDLTVKDNGIGFEMQYIDRVFQPFGRLHGRSEYEGSGIGLAICRKIVERHGGMLTAESTPGQGSTFIVMLPVKQG